MTHQHSMDFRPNSTALRTNGARLIAQLHRQAMATANDLAVRQTAIKADIAKDARRRKTVAWMSIAGTFIVVLGSILALLAMTE
jgi:hypothetical protein